ncbi:helix-turn-helix domain-containing protein [Niabella sp. 22666]|uniref:helix-turn-helix domain-containing protein n=1 Tax=Niabella sp. 22666 TaxID=3453954 RepID=UPI003F874478
MNKEEIKKLNLAFGENLRKIRDSKKISLLQLSYNCSIDESKISKIEHGRFNIKLSTVFELAKGLDISPEKLLHFPFEQEM